MTVQLETRPVLSQPESVGWCRTAVFSESPQNVSPENQPVWLVVISTESADSDEKGIELLGLVEQTYHSLELKTAEALYQTLANSGPIVEQSSIVAACITLTTVTVMTKGQAGAKLVRGNQTHSIIESEVESWQAIEGNWQKDDIWWLETGKNRIQMDQTINGLAANTFIRLGEELVAKMNQANKSQAGLLIHLTEAVLKEDHDNKINLISSPENILSNEEVKLRQKKRRIFFLGWLVLILLVVSVFFGSKARQSRLIEQEYQALTIQVDQTIAVVSALYQTDQVKAREQMRSTMTVLESAQVRFKDNEVWMTKWQALYDKANQTYQTISGEKSVEEVPVWYPLNTIKSDFTGKQMMVCGENLVVWDETTSTLVKIDTENKRNDIVAGGQELAGLKYVACDGNRAVVLANVGIVDISLSRQSTTTIVEADPEWQQPKMVGLFNNNIYLVDEAAQLIWRYPAITGGVGAKQNWFGQGVSLSGTGYVRMSIDGQLWLLQSSGKISLFTRGAPQSFAISGLDQPLGSFIPSFVVDGEKDQLAILDGSNSRVIIANKKGEYKKQVGWSGLATANDIAFSPNQDTLFVLNQGNIYAINY